ncbi:calmodulin [Thraustotheca clavata]|uniref:Calmodulin n=1 Tax=Thraustotheca clavata TaxID=74557 RepID=A0A1V9YHN9_9STRA|nr:calmodulin [Thraustotheca clavata]
MDAFDHKERLTKETAHLRQAEVIKPVDVPVTYSKVINEAKNFVGTDNTSEFSEAEILSAFKFIDLDKNTFIGAAEIRHILICMGELITDAEVDMMVKMVDRDGDGQISFEEFRKMVIHPDPGDPSFGKDDEPAPTEVVQKAEVVTEEDKRRDMEIKMQKKMLLDKFIADNNVNLDMLRRIFNRFRNSEKTGLSFEDFYTLFEVEPTGEYRKLHSLYAGTQLADIREVLLGMSNLLDIEKSVKAQFCFEIYDDDHNGFITEDELINILKATHMSTEAQVQKKAKTILRQCDGDGDNKIDLEEFYLISKKFPNILFPKFTT